MLEERVVLHLDFMKEDPLAETVQAKRLRVRDEMDLVTPLRQLHPQLGGHRT